MGRRDAVPFTLECVAEWRRLGALVTFEPGWETRGNGTSANYEGASEHHTGVDSSLARPFPTRNTLISGRSDLGGPLTNDATPVGPGDRPHIHVIAAHPANHAGASGGRGTAPLPVTRLFNPLMRGNEIDYAGDRPMTPGQRLAALIHGRGVVNVLRRGVDYIKAHAETSVTGKWDPGYAPGKTIDMAAFRRDAANLGAGHGPAPLEEDDDMPQAISHFVPAGEQHTYPIPPPQSGAAGWGRAFLSIAVDRHGADKAGVEPPASYVRIAVQGEGGTWRPVFGTDPVMPIRPGTRPVVELRKGDQVVVLESKDKDYGVGLLIEYAPR